VPVGGNFVHLPKRHGSLVPRKARFPHPISGRAGNAHRVRLARGGPLSSGRSTSQWTCRTYTCVGNLLTGAPLRNCRKPSRQALDPAFPAENSPFPSASN
jgi:hypothetical protein